MGICLNMNYDKDKIVEWLLEKCNDSNCNGFVVGVSGGVDSALTSTLCAHTKKPVIVVGMPINQQIDQLSFDDFRSAVGQPKEVVGKNLVLHLVDDNTYLSVKFTSWSSGNKGGFSYERSTP